ncbi:MAG TPA: holo-ACP synthase [Nocardioidaceae bacterium]|nr:holo-ACP synthase [Nocardioidaceae bacterium]
MATSPGTDIVGVARVARLIDERGQDFLERWFTPAEIAYCSAKARPSLHFAARLAAKEAVVKALRLPWDGPLPWRDVEIVHDEHGAPRVRLSGRMRRSAEREDVRAIDVSLSHCEEYATATAVADLVGRASGPVS